MICKYRNLYKLKCSFSLHIYCIYIVYRFVYMIFYGHQESAGAHFLQNTRTKDGSGFWGFLSNILPIHLPVVTLLLCSVCISFCSVQYCRGIAKKQESNHGHRNDFWPSEVGKQFVFCVILRRRCNTGKVLAEGTTMYRF
jgi:hypothetical protein